MQVNHRHKARRPPSPLLALVYLLAGTAATAQGSGSIGLSEGDDPLRTYPDGRQLLVLSAPDEAASTIARVEAQVQAINWTVFGSANAALVWIDPESVTSWTPVRIGSDRTEVRIFSHRHTGDSLRERVMCSANAYETLWLSASGTVVARSQRALKGVYLAPLHFLVPRL